MSDESRMCATVEPYKIRSGKIEEATQLGKKLRSEFQKIPGRKHMIDVFNNDGYGYTISIWESPEAKAAAASRLDELGAQFGDMFEEFEAHDFQTVEYFVGK